MAKKRMAILFAAILLFGAAGKAQAADIEMNDTDNTRDTQVEAKVDQGVSPTYVVTIPAKVDFGTLTRPAADAVSPKVQDFNISITKLDGLGAREILAILALGSGSEGAFTLANAKGKPLAYTFLQGGGDITGRNKYANGWYVITAKAITQTPIACQLSLDQNQLNKGPMDEWEGTFSGSIRFYTTIADMDDYMNTTP